MSMQSVGPSTVPPGPAEQPITSELPTIQKILPGIEMAVIEAVLHGRQTIRREDLPEKTWSKAEVIELKRLVPLLMARISEMSDEERSTRTLQLLDATSAPTKEERRLNAPTDPEQPGLQSSPAPAVKPVVGSKVEEPNSSKKAEEILWKMRHPDPPAAPQEKKKKGWFGS